MKKPDFTCEQTCKDCCNALDFAIQSEKEAILHYAELRDQCTYPGVKLLLNELIIHRQKSIQLLEENKVHLKSKFEVLDQIREGFEM